MPVERDRSSEQGEPSTRAYWDRVEEVFAAALAAERSARTAVLDARCDARDALRADVEVLLEAHARAGEFIEPLATPNHSSAASAPADAPAAGTRIGAFQLRERIAKGGMGDVYRAERVEGE